MATMTTRTLTETETATYESSGPDGDAFRREIRNWMRATGRASCEAQDAESVGVEIHSHDGITLDHRRVSRDGDWA